MNNQILKLLEKFSKEENPFKSATLYVRDIPYGDIGSRDPVDILHNNMGTCSGKHFLLKEIYTNLGLKTKDMIAIHKFNDMNLTLSESLENILQENDIWDPHNFLSVNINNNWINIDVTWDKPLGKIGLEINEDWDGLSDMKIAVAVTEEIEVESGLEYKKEYIKKLDPEVQEVRKNFIKKFGEYLREVR